MINIVCNIDDTYVDFCKLMLLGLFKNNPDEEFTVYVIETQVKESANKKIKELESTFRVDIVFCEVPYSFIENYPIKEQDHLSLAAYLRIFISDLLPQTVDKVLYLDCDLLIMDSIADLWNIDLEEFAVAAVEERPPFDVESPRTLGYPESYSYFNSGVMLINLKYWRKLQLSKACQEYISENFDKIELHDQDVLNALLYDKKKLLPIRWNLMDFFLFTKLDIQKRRLNDLCAAFEKPAIVHFTGRRKPWVHNCDSPFRKRYVQLAREYNCHVVPVVVSAHYYIRYYWYLFLRTCKLKRKKVLTASDINQIITDPQKSLILLNNKTR